MNMTEFWSEVLACFENEMGEKIQGYDAIIVKGKSLIRPRIAAFNGIYDRVKQMDESGSCDLFVFQNALVEYETQYGHAFYVGAVLENSEKLSCFDTN
ncbi:hypothetical protein Tco_0859904 [Tanacetum coccineum]|uniref:Uncharacterized protein n=1 Tax=Tanacetum coccineum TaxID=301880 RepID=A0ABQ5BGF6_9ASTR